MEIQFTLGSAVEIKNAKKIDVAEKALQPTINQLFSVGDDHQQKHNHSNHFLIGPQIFNNTYYPIKSNLLVGTGVSEIARAKLRSWLYEETSRLGASRHLCGYACTYVDLYLSQGAPIALQQLQNLAIGCLVLANKLTDNILLKFNDSVFPQQAIKKWEKKICICLQFRLNPVTYVTIMGWLLASWNAFAEKQGLWVYKTDRITTNDKLDFTTAFFEALDFFALHSKSVGYSRGVLQLQVFTLINRNNFEKIKQQQSIEDEVVINLWTNPEEEVTINNLITSSFEVIHQKFESFAQKYHPWIGRLSLDERKETENWIKDILPQNMHLIGQNGTHAGGVKVWMQTANPKWLVSMKKVFTSQKANDERKRSVETTF